ncbi:MAG: hypothetical protein SFV53_00970 [Rickettsiales bacterium]|nr:hypothetical protein [Rickettsiales bacterium]
MKKFLLLFLLLAPYQIQAQENSTQNQNLTQGLWKGILEEEIQNSSAPAKFFDPNFSAGLVTDFNYDHNYQSQDSVNNYNDSLLKTILASKAALNKHLSLQSVIRLDELNKYNSDFATNSSGGNVAASTGNSRYFQDEALRVDEIALNYTNKNLTILAGKFVPNFGLNWKWGRGIWSNNLSSNYRQMQKIGGGFSYKMGDRKKTGQYNFGFSTFTNDQTGLNNSLINKSAPYDKNSATPGNAGGILQSYVASIDVLFDFSQKEKLSYHFSYLNLGVNSNVATTTTSSKIGDQQGYAAALNYRYPIIENFLIDALVEYVDMKNVGGNSDITQKYSTASLVGEIYQNWNVTLATTLMAQRQINYNGFNQNLSEISFGYKFDKTAFFDQILLQAGYKNFRTNYKTDVVSNDSLGFLVRYIKAF